jgi:hypothetical protein
VLENRGLRRIFRPKREEVAGGFTKLRSIRLAGYVAHMNLMRNAYKILVGTPEGKRQLVRPRRRWEGNI